MHQYTHTNRLEGNLKLCWVSQEQLTAYFASSLSVDHADNVPPRQRLATAAVHAAEVAVQLRNVTGHVRRLPLYVRLERLPATAKASSCTVTKCLICLYAPPNLDLGLLIT